MGGMGGMGGGMNSYQQGGINMGGLGSSGLNSAAISYPTPRSSHQQGGGGGGFGGLQQNMGGSGGMNNQNNQNNKVFTGTVTKLHDSFGFVDDNVFFQMSVVKGQAPRVGDRVLVEAVFNAGMPFKWNATRITPIPGAASGGNDNSGGTGLLGSAVGHNNKGPAMGGGSFGGQRGFGAGAGGFGGSGNDLRDEVMNAGRDRNRDRAHRSTRSPIRRDDKRRDDRERSSRKRSRSKSKSRSRSPPRRRARHQPRYNVSVPKISLNFPCSNVMELRKRYSSLYVPSDFFTAKHVWSEAFPIEAPFRIRQASAFHVFNREHVEPLTYNPRQFDPEDADYRYVAKVMLLAAPELEDLYEKTCHLIEKDSQRDDPREGLVHPSRALKFLVGMKGKSETMAIGGPWSPSLDGSDPVNDPGVLIKTAVRTCGAMTGIDLSACTQWTRFIEIHYRRQATNTKPARTETVVIFLPDVWSLMPTKEEHDATCASYEVKCQMKLDGKSVTPEEGVADPENAMNEDEGEEELVKKGEPTHWKELDPKTMKVNDLKAELEARAQSSKGLKSQLQARLQKQLKNEQDSEEKGTEDDAVDKEKEEDKEEEADEETVVLDDKTKEKIKSCYKTGSSPCLFVHPNTKVKSGKFDCKVETLSVLLDYRTDDNKEGTFEISLFAELFNEMLMRDNAFNIYKAIANAPEKVENKSEDKDKDDEKEKKKDKEEDKDKEEEKKSMISRNKELLLSCSYFDLSHTGYFEAKDLEDIFLALELELSRAEVKKVVAKLVASRDHVNYRPLIDVEVGAPETEELAGSKTDKELASGFRQYVPGTDQAAGADAASDSSPLSLDTNKLVKFRGSVLDIGKLVEKMDKAEKLRSDIQSRLVSIQKELAVCKEQSDKFLGQKEKLTVELKASKDKLRTVEGELMCSRGEAAKYLAALKDVMYRVKPLAEPPKSEEPAGDVKLNGVDNKDAIVKTDEMKAEEEKVENTATEVPAVASAGDQMETQD